MKIRSSISPMLDTHEAAEFLGVGAGIKMSGTNQEDRLLAVDQAAELLGAAVGTMRWWRRPKVWRGPPFVKVEGRIRYRLSDLQKYLEENTVRPGRGAAPFYRQTRVEELGAKHPGLCEFVEKQVRRHVPYPRIAEAVLKRWGEPVSNQVLSSFYIARVWPKILREERAEAEKKKLPGLS